MLALLLWVAGCIFGAWVLWHWQLWREAMAMVVTFSVVLWFLGGAAVLSGRGGLRDAMLKGKRQWVPKPPEAK